jgi:hypothetical protein
MPDFPVDLAVVAAVKIATPAEVALLDKVMPVAQALARMVLQVAVAAVRVPLVKMDQVAVVVMVATDSKHLFPEPQHITPVAAARVRVTAPALAA